MVILPGSYSKLGTMTYNFLNLMIVFGGGGGGGASAPAYGPANQYVYGPALLERILPCMALT